jgi:hypothetical protein
MDAIHVMPTDDQVILERPTLQCSYGFIWGEVVLILRSRAFDLMLYWGCQIFDSKTRDTTFEEIDCMSMLHGPQHNMT